MEVDKEYNFMGWFGKVFTEEAKKTDNGWLLPFKNMEEFLKRVEFHANKISTHPQREALDEEKFKNWLLDFMVVNEIFFQCSGRAHEDVLGMVSNNVCQTFAAPSLEDLLSALPEDGGMVTPEGKHGWNACITALKGLWGRNDL